MTQVRRRLIGENELAACGCSPRDRVLVALSGGADSTALLLSMRELRDEGRIGALFAAHLNHGIRGARAEHDQRCCEALCERLSIPFATEMADVPAYAGACGQSLEQAGREVRYEFLERARVSFVADVIATAHHRDDQAETLLLNLIRGSGLAGLCGMQPRNGRVIRPMLGVSRAEILGYLSERGEAYCEDETNADCAAARNRIRNELMPLLRRYNPSIARSLSKTAELLSQDEALLSRMAGEAEREIALGEGLDRERFGALALPIRARIARSRLLLLSGNVSEADIRRVLALTEARTGTVIGLSGGYAAWTDAHALMIGSYPRAAAYAVPFTPAGETVTPRGTLRSERVRSWRTPADGMEAYLDREKLPRDMVVRSRHAGDRFYPLGAPGEKKLSDFFTDKKIAKEQRDLPLLCCRDEVFYVFGVSVSERVKITPDTREILHIICYRGTRD